MAKKKSLSNTNTGLFSKTEATEKTEATPTKDLTPSQQKEADELIKKAKAPKRKPKAPHRPKIIPDNFEKFNFQLDPKFVKQLRLDAIENDTSINLMLNEIIKKHIESK